MEHVIYKLTSPKGKVYIGRTINFEDRMTQHKYESIKTRRDYPLYRAIRKYGWDNFTKEIIATAFTDTDAALLESAMISKYDTVKKGYNSTDNTFHGGNVWKGRDNEFGEFKRKMSRVTAGNKNGMYGKQQSESAKEKQRQKAQGRFTLQWYINRNGVEEGTQLYNQRSEKLRQRNLQRSASGKFTKSDA